MIASGNRNTISGTHNDFFGRIGIDLIDIYNIAAITFIDPSALMYIQKKAAQLNATGGNK